MPESQTVEWKQVWKDEYLKVLCAFANADGGELHVGRQDDGKVCGVANSKRLLEDIPNKARDVLGIIVAAHLNDQVVVIRVDPYPSPISFRGHYYLRSGATTQELKGPALERFLLRKRGRTWDGIPVPGLSLADLDAASLESFRHFAKNGGRMDADGLSGSDDLLLERLRLRDGDYLTQAAAILFATEPDRVVTGATVKVGYFKTLADVAWHDEFRGDLLRMAQTILDTVYLKYLKGVISYRDIHRVETYPVPRPALREALFNALIHRDYSVPAPIQIKVFPDRLSIWNPAVLPDGWTVADLQAEHPSRPHNPLIAGVAFRAGEVEAWGRGIQRIQAACQEGDAPSPTITYEHSEFRLTFPFSQAYLDAVGEVGQDESPSGSTTQKTTQKTTQNPQEYILAYLRENPQAGRRQIAEDIGGITQDGVKYHLARLKDEGRIRRIGPDRGGRWEVLDA